LPLESPDVEILEGRYRIMARSPLKQAIVEIHITHEALDEEPPKRRTQKRTQQTNQNGLLVVIPYTTLKPGLWAISCSSTADFMSDLLGDSWKYGIQLHVLPESDFSEPSEPDWQGVAAPLSELHLSEPQQSEPQQTVETVMLIEAGATADSEHCEMITASYHSEEIALPVLEEFAALHPATVSETLDELPSLALAELAESEPLSPSSPDFVSPDLEPKQDCFEGGAAPLLADSIGLEVISATPQEEAGSSVEEWLQRAELMSQHMADEILEEYGLSPADLGVLGELPDAPPSIVPSHPPLQIELAQDTYVVHRGQTLVLRGRVSPAEEVTDGLPTLVSARLKVVLRDPQSAKVLLETQEPIQSQALPMDLTYQLTLPSELRTQLILGEVTLYDATHADHATSDNVTDNALSPEDVMNEDESRLLSLTRSSERILASQPFILTADAATLLEAATIQASEAAARQKALEEAAISEQHISKEEGLPKEDVPAPPLPRTAKGAPLDLAFLSMVERVKSPQFESLAADLKKSLPPQIFVPSDASENRKGLDLPNFLPSTLPALDPSYQAFNPFALGEFEFDQSEPEQLNLFNASELEDVDRSTPSKASHLAELEATAPEPNLTEIISQGPLQQLSLEEFAEIDLIEPTDLIESTDLIVEEALEEPPQEKPTKQTFIQSAFRALNLHDRFFNRLNSLASPPPTLAELSTSSESSDGLDESSPTSLSNSSEVLSKALEPDTLGAERQLGAKTPSRIREGTTDAVRPEENFKEILLPEVSSVDEDLASYASGSYGATNYEIVVDSEPVLPLAKLTLSLAQKPSLVELHPSNNPFLLSEHEPVPAPLLEVIETELIGGQTMSVRVKLPDILPKIYVKLWVHDRQNRVVLEGPRWVSDFSPNGLEAVEAIAELPVPLGSVDIEVAAIAVEMTTKRESHKVTLDRPVTPPDFSDLTLNDEFDD
jgi:hypothetical protein